MWTMNSPSPVIGGSGLPGLYKQRKSGMSETDDKAIMFYSTAWCPDCTRARAFLDKQRIAYVNVDIDESPEGRAVVEKFNHGMRSVPTIVFSDGSILVEPSNAQLAQKLGLSVKA